LLFFARPERPFMKEVSLCPQEVELLPGRFRRAMELFRGSRPLIEEDAIIYFKTVDGVCVVVDRDIREAIGGIVENLRRDLEALGRQNVIDSVF